MEFTVASFSQGEHAPVGGVGHGSLGYVGSTRMADHIGRVLGDRYRLLAPVGSGGSGHVFVADDVRLRRRVAVKMLHPALADDEAFLKRFRAEARAAAALNHPNVMAVYDWGEEDEGPYLVCEYLGGGSLRSVLDRGRRLSPSQALLVGLEAARGLDYAHRRGLVHRDIKPANLLFDLEGRLRIGDFGLARALAEAAWTEPIGAVLGTARYASPEQVSGAPIDGRADVYSLALVLVEAVTGQVPFAADTTVATLMGRLDKPIEPPPELGPLAAAVARAGRPDPAERLDAAGLASALQSVALTLPAPEPLPLAGAATVDEMTAIGDHTDVGPRPGEPPRRPAPTTAAATATAATETRAAAFEPTRAPAADPDPDPDATGMVASSGPEATGATPVVPPAAARAAAKAAAKAAANDDTIRQAAPTTVARTTPVREPAAPPYVPPELSRAGRRRRRRWPYLVLIFLVLAAGVGAGSYYLVSSRAPSHPLPDVVGQTELQAATALRALKFDVQTREEYFDGSTPGEVKLQTPAGGGEATLKEGKRVTLVVSKGPAPTPVPDLAALDEAGARKAIEAVGHVVGTVTARNDETVPAGGVLEWTHKGESPPKGVTVDLVVSDGPAPRELPNLAGKSFDEAASALDALGLDADRIDAYTDDDGSAGKVTGTDPGAGTKVSRGTTVTVTVSKGQPAVPKLSGLSADDAAAALEAGGLHVGSTFGPNSGDVFLTLPGEGTKVKPGASVTIYLL
ncbi:MAG: eukaryotic-like serine/threonine-protein kinase [Actinomycetota bacterium]|nr:eukaryotic-like serine/threonine-protein kinase [Actinomycetota bacterium]